MSGVGGYVRRCERVQGTIERPAVRCDWCRVAFADVRAGTAQHDMSMHQNMFIQMPPLRFEPFDITETP